MADSSYSIKVTTNTSVVYFTLSSLSTVSDFVINNLVTGTTIELVKL